MTDAYNAGREAGIREAAAVASGFGCCHVPEEIAAGILALLDAPAPAGVNVQEAARLICEEVLQKACPVAGMHRLRMINATLEVRIPSIPRAQRWAIVNAALRALSEDRT